jgi:hypothetical protein
MLCVAQFYDSLFVMNGEFIRIQAKLREKVFHASIFLHCHAHRLNLVLTDCLKTNQPTFGIFYLVKQISQPLEFSIW